MRPMRFERAIDLIARQALSWSVGMEETKQILHPIGPANIDRVLERMKELREDLLRPNPKLKDQAWNLLLEDGNAR